MADSEAYNYPRLFADDNGPTAGLVAILEKSAFTVRSDSTGLHGIEFMTPADITHMLQTVTEEKVNCVHDDHSPAYQYRLSPRATLRLAERMEAMGLAFVPPETVELLKKRHAVSAVASEPLPAAAVQATKHTPFSIKEIGKILRGDAFTVRLTPHLGGIEFSTRTNITSGLNALLHTNVFCQLDKQTGLHIYKLAPKHALKLNELLKESGPRFTFIDADGIATLQAQQAEKDRFKRAP